MSRAATALLPAVKESFPAGTFAAEGGPDVKGAKLGFVALTDASLLIIAQEKGFFAKYGLTEMKIEKQASWAATRDNIELGSANGGIDGSHILSPMPYHLSIGKITKNNIYLQRHPSHRRRAARQGAAVFVRCTRYHETVVLSMT